jgi:hypothetical protein
MNSGGRTSRKQLMKRSFAVMFALAIGGTVLVAEPSLAIAERLKVKVGDKISAIVVEDWVNLYLDPNTNVAGKIEKLNRGTILKITVTKTKKKLGYRVRKSGNRYYLRRSGFGVLKGEELKICKNVKNNNFRKAELDLIIDKYFDGNCLKAIPKEFSKHFANETAISLQKLKESVCKNTRPHNNFKCEKIASDKWDDVRYMLIKDDDFKINWDKLNDNILEFEDLISYAKNPLMEWDSVHADMVDVRESINNWMNKIRKVGRELQAHKQLTKIAKLRASDQNPKPPIKATRERPQPRRNTLKRPSVNASTEPQQTSDQGKKQPDKSNGGNWGLVSLLLSLFFGIATVGTVGFFAWRAWVNFCDLREKVKSLGKDVMRLQHYVSSLQNPGLERNNRAASDRDLRGRDDGGLADPGQAYRRRTNIGRSSAREKVEPPTVKIVELMEDYARALMEPHAMDTMKSKWQGVGAIRYSDGAGTEEAVYLEMVDPRMFDEAEFWAFPYDNKGLYLICPGRSVRKQVASLVADDGRPAKKKFGGILDIQGGTNFELKTSAVARENGNMLKIIKMGILQLPAN